MSAMISVSTRPPRRASAAALTLLESARRCVAESVEAVSPASRYCAAHLGALRAAAAVLAARAAPGAGARRRKPRSAWDLLPEAAPELTEWAGFFAAGAATRAAAEAGLPRAVTIREADDLLRATETFLGLVTSVLGVGDQPPLPLSGSTLAERC